MKDITGTKAASQRGLRKGSKWLLYVAVSAVALLLIPSFAVGVDDSSAEPELSGFHPGLYDGNGHKLEVPLFTDPNIPFDTETREDGTFYQVVAGQPIDCVPAFFAVSADNNADRGRFKVTVWMEGLDNTWMDYCGVRVYATSGQNVFHADLTKAGQYKAHFFVEDEVIANFENDVMYRISLETLGGSQSSTAPGPIENITVWFEAELIPDYSIVQFTALGRIVEDRILYEDDKVGTLPELTMSGYTLEGWYDPEGNQVTADTHVYDLAHTTERLIVVDAKCIDDGHWPKVIEWDDSPIHHEDGSVTYTHHKLIIFDANYPNGKWIY